MSTVLIIDDEVALVRSLSFALKGEGYTVYGAHTAAAGLEAADQFRPEAILLDLRLPDMSGQQVLDALRTRHAGTPVVMISAHGDTREAVRALKSGAVDYLSKPFELDELFQLLTSAVRRPRLVGDRPPPPSEPAAGTIAGDSRSIRALESLVGKVAESSSARVLVQGESGTGKALVARAIHARSARAKKPFIEVNCASLPEPLVEAELFGAEKGAYTGAYDRRAGLIALADGGTLFLDEIGELPLALQPKFLHFLENGDYRAIGSGQRRTADVRVIAATNRDLAEEVRAGRFREDLFYRINVIQIRVPPLRERGDDILRLAELFALRFGREERCRPIRFLPEAQALLIAHPWPGNVRELKNLIERLTVLMPGQAIAAGDLPPDMRNGSAESGGDDGGGSIVSCLASTERQLLEDALRTTAGHKGRAAELLGISRHALKRRLHRLGLD
ncbi:MAG: response regulator [Azospirillum sp.]|nr:response regulator [Azospirillum sp.]